MLVVACGVFVCFCFWVQKHIGAYFKHFCLFVFNCTLPPEFGTFAICQVKDSSPFFLKNAGTVQWSYTSEEWKTLVFILHPFTGGG